MSSDNAKIHPLFAVPEEDDEVLCFAVLPVGVDASSRDEVLRALRAVDGMMRAEGDKRYLSGWLFDPDWRAHYGAAHSVFEETRSRYGATGVFRSALFPD